MSAPPASGHPAQLGWDYIDPVSRHDKVTSEDELAEGDLVVPIQKGGQYGIDHQFPTYVMTKEGLVRVENGKPMTMDDPESGPYDYYRIKPGSFAKWPPR